MLRLPEVLGLILCTRMDVDSDSGGLSLIGMFHSFRFQQYPSPVEEFALYCALYDGIGEGTIELVITHLASDKDVYQQQKWLAFPGRLQIVNFEMHVSKCLFPVPGQYLFDLRFEKERLARRIVDVYQE